MESARASLDQFVANFDWISNVTHSYDFNTLLRSNAPPSPLQSVDLKYSLDNMVYVTQKLQAALDLLGNAVASLEAHMSRVQSLQHDYEVMLSPIRRVPVEIIMEILHCTQTAAGDPEEADFGGYNVFTCAEGPRLLGQVCRSWRDIVSTLPRLWATLTISVPRDGRRWNRKCAVNMLEQALEHTRGHPLDILLKYPDGLSDDEYRIMDLCINIMMASSGRWRRAGFIVHHSFLRHLSCLHGKIDLLTDVYLDSRPDSGSRRRDLSPITGFEIAPRLKSLHLKGLDASIRFSFPTANLVLFCDQQPVSGDQLDPVYTKIVKFSPKLLSFSYHDYAFIPRRIGLPPSHPRVTSQSIQSLSVSSPNLLRRVDVPALREVVLTNPHGNHSASDVITTLSDLIRHSHCSLTRLSVVNVTIVDDDLIAVLRLTPCLEELFVQFDRLWEKHRLAMRLLMESLAETILEEHALVPSLTSLGIVLKGIHYIPFVDPSFVTMITSRHESGALMKLVLHLGVGSGDVLRSADKEKLELLTLTGLVLDFTVN
ncbi:hypothetical protein EDD85DRAFT_853304 [Armillaria nabsnona]|nr:hypothetical protein EDD85DRAFT_853304 [Armillaria nabsnona]